jgi:hypothetical protein
MDATSSTPSKVSRSPGVMVRRGPLATATYLSQTDLPAPQSFSTESS